MGAITGTISFRRHVTISVNDQGLYRLAGVPGVPAFTDIEDAGRYASAHLHEVLNALAVAAGATTPHICIGRQDSAAAAAEGDVVFISRTIEGRVHARPRMAPADVAAG